MNETMIKELVKDWQNEKISSFAAMVALSAIVFPTEVDESAIEWARKIIAEVEGGAE